MDCLFLFLEFHDPGKSQVTKRVAVLLGRTTNWDIQEGSMHQRGWLGICCNGPIKGALIKVIKLEYLWLFSSKVWKTITKMVYRKDHFTTSGEGPNQSIRLKKIFIINVSSAIFVNSDMQPGAQTIATSTIGFRHKAVNRCCRGW